MRFATKQIQSSGMDIRKVNEAVASGLLFQRYRALLESFAPLFSSGWSKTASMKGHSMD